LVKIHWRMLILECSQGCYMVIIWPCDLDSTLTWYPFMPKWPELPSKWKRPIGQWDNINILQWILTKLGTYLVLTRIWNPIDFQGHWVKFLSCNILLNTRIDILPWILKDVNSRVFTRMLLDNNLTRWPWSLTYDLENQ
jgi:hypothetical protein